MHSWWKMQGVAKSSYVIIWTYENTAVSFPFSVSLIVVEMKDDIMHRVLTKFLECQDPAHSENTRWKVGPLAENLPLALSKLNQADSDLFS